MGRSSTARKEKGPSEEVRSSVESQKKPKCSFCGRESASVQVLVVSSSEGVYICERCVDVAKQIADSKVGGTSGLSVIRKTPTEVARDTISLLRQMRDENVLSGEDYERRCLRLINQVAPDADS